MSADEKGSSEQEKLTEYWRERAEDLSIENKELRQYLEFKDKLIDQLKSNDTKRPQDELVDNLRKEIKKRDEIIIKFQNDPMTNFLDNILLKMKSATERDKYVNLIQQVNKQTNLVKKWEEKATNLSEENHKLKSEIARLRALIVGGESKPVEKSPPPEDSTSLEVRNAANAIGINAEKFISMFDNLA